MSYKLQLEQIENGFIVTRSQGKIYAENADLAIKHAQVALDEMRKEIKASKQSTS